MKAILNTYSATELKEFIKKTNIKGFSKLKKDGLVSLMTKAEHKGKFNHIKEKGGVAKKAPVKKSKAVPELTPKYKELLKRDQERRRKAKEAKSKPPPPPKTPPPKTKTKFKSVVSELNKKGKEYREARKDFGKDDPLRPKKKKTVEPKKVKKIVKKTELIPYKKNKIAISITEDKSKGKSYPHKNLVGRGKAPVPPPSGKVLKLPPKKPSKGQKHKGKKYSKVKLGGKSVGKWDLIGDATAEYPKYKGKTGKIRYYDRNTKKWIKEIGNANKTTHTPKLDKPTSQRKKVKQSLINKTTKGKGRKLIKNIQQKKRKMGELHIYNPTLSSIQELPEPEPPYQGKLKADDFADSGYSPQAYKRIYGEIPEVSPTYDTGYKMDISEIQDPLTFDYNIKTPIFHKGTTLFDKKKHDKGVMPNEVYESIYGKDIDTEALIKGNNLTPKLKEDIEAVNKKKEIIARRKAKGKKLLDKAKGKKLDKLIEKKFEEHKKNTFMLGMDNYEFDINYDNDSDEEDYRYSNRAPLNVAEYDYFNDILTAGYDPHSESSINRRKDMNMYDNMPIIETILPLSNLPNPIELTERGKIPNSMNGYKPAEKYAVRTTKLDGIPALSPAKVITKDFTDTFHPPALLIVPPVPANKLEVVAKGRKKYSNVPPKRKKGFKPKIVARSAKGAERSKKIAEGNKQLAKVSQAQRQTEGDKNPLALTIFDKSGEGSNQGGNQLHPDFRREAKRQGYTDYNQGQKTYDDESFGSFGEDWEDDPTHPQYKPKPKHDYGQSYNRSGVVSGAKSVNPFASNTQIRIRGREEKQEDGEATSGQKTKLNAGLLAGIERQKLKKKGIEVKDTNESVFTKKGKQEFADKFIEQAKNTDKKMSKEWIKRYVEQQRKDRPNQEYSSKTEAFSKMAEKMFSDYRKEELKARPLALKGKEDKYQTQRKAFQDKFDEFNKKAQQDLKGSKLTVGKKKKLKEQLEQKRKRLDINLKKLGEKFNK